MNGLVRYANRLLIHGGDNMVILINSASGHDGRLVTNEKKYIDYDKAFEEIEWKPKKIYAEDVPDKFRDTYAYDCLEKDYYRYVEIGTLMGLQKVVDKVGSIIINPRDDNSNAMFEAAIGQKIDLEIKIYDYWVE